MELRPSATKASVPQTATLATRAEAELALSLLAGDWLDDEAPLPPPDVGVAPPGAWEPAGGFTAGLSEGAFGLGAGEPAGGLPFPLGVLLGGAGLGAFVGLPAVGPTGKVELVNELLPPEPVMRMRPVLAATAAKVQVLSAASSRGQPT